jgi:hypothetical protein
MFPKYTSLELSEPLKPDPVIVTTVPTAPEVGENDEITGDCPNVVTAIKRIAIKKEEFLDIKLIFENNLTKYITLLLNEKF